MPVYDESRYAGSRLAPVAASDGVFRVTIQPALGDPIIDDFTMHLVVEGDSLDRLADRAYGDSEFWWRIADANLDVLLGYPDDLVPGQLLRIPVLAVDL